MAGRKIADADDARCCLAKAAASGMARAEWARANGINARSLQIWRVLIERARPRPTELKLVEMVAEPPPRKPSRYLIRCADLEVEVDDQFDDEVLRRLLAVVTTC